MVLLFLVAWEYLPDLLKEIRDNRTQKVKELKVKLDDQMRQWQKQKAGIIPKEGFLQSPHPPG